MSIGTNALKKPLSSPCSEPGVSEVPWEAAKLPFLSFDLLMANELLLGLMALVPLENESCGSRFVSANATGAQTQMTG